MSENCSSRTYLAARDRPLQQARPAGTVVLFGTRRRGLGQQELNVHVAGYEDSDLDERTELAGSLSDELRALDVEDISRPAAEAPAGAKGSAFEWAQLVVTLAGSLPPLLAAVRAWLARHPGASIALEIDGDRLELTDASAGERRELIEAWMQRHGG